MLKDDRQTRKAVRKSISDKCKTMQLVFGEGYHADLKKFANPDHTYLICRNCKTKYDSVLLEKTDTCPNCNGDLKYGTYYTDYCSYCDELKIEN